MKILWVMILLCGFQWTHSQMVSCQQGSFNMGSNEGADDELPIHTVELSSFKISAHEVTEAQYDSCVSTGKCTPAHYNDGKCVTWNGSRFISVKVSSQNRNQLYPVVCVSWYQARAFCSWKGMKLPTEAQWEYAARANGQGKYSWGNEIPTNQRCTMAGTGHPTEVSQYPSNRWGLYDMTGNVWEWTSDFYGSDEYSQSVSKNPAGPDVGQYRVIRGGGWYSSGEQLRVANRHWFSPGYAEVSLGFRCVSNN